MLLEKRVSINSKDENGNISFHTAVKSGNMGIIRLMVQHGADINAQNDKGETALHTAASLNNKDLVRFWCSLGASVSIRDESGHTRDRCNAVWKFHLQVDCLHYFEKSPEKAIMTEASTVSFSCRYPRRHHFLDVQNCNNSKR